MNMLVNACLLEVECRYNDRGALIPQAEEPLNRHHPILVCSEILSGLATSRIPTGRVGTGVITRDGGDATIVYEKGAGGVLKLTQLYGYQVVILREGGPSRGSGQVYDGTLTGTLTEGDGVCAACLKGRGVKIHGESQVGRLLEDIKR